MAKKSKKKSGKQQGKKDKGSAISLGAATGAAAGIAGDVLVRVLSDVINDSLSQHLKKGSTKGNAGDEGAGADDLQHDVAARILKVLIEHGPQTIPDLLHHAGGRLVDVLAALKDVREFRLVEFVGDDNRVQLTATGNRTATVLSRNHIRHSAELLLAK